MKEKIRKLWLYVVIGVIAVSIGFLSVFLTIKGKRLRQETDLGGAREEMYSGEFWAKRTKGKEILSKEEITDLNKSIKNGENGFVDLYAFKSTISGDELLKKIELFKTPNGSFYTGKGGTKPADKAFYKHITANRNLGGILSSNPVFKAVTVNETEVRDFPASDPLYAQKGEIEMDLFCENRMYVFEKCLVLHTSSDGEWLFIQGDSFIGWIKAEDAAVCSEDDWLWLDDSEKLVVVGGYVVTDADPYDSGLSERKLSMGTRLPVCDEEIQTINQVSTVSSFAAYMPFRNKYGRLYKKAVRIPKSGNVRKGYLPLTSKNIILQAFKLLGERYGWGASYGARDCSAYVRDVYRCFGVELPKNSANQGNIGVKGRTDLSGLGDKEKERAIKKLPPGAILEMKGHVMLYIGKCGGKAFVIHDVYAFGEAGKKDRTVINCVTVSDLYVTRKDGTSFLSNIRSAVCFGK